MITLPPLFEERMRKLLGADFENYKAALNEIPIKAFRVNTDKISVEEFEKLEFYTDKKVPYCDNAYYLENQKLGNHPYHHAGMIYIQEPAAMAPAECIDIQPDWNILDMCAAPGGKSSQLKNKLGENGVLVSNEIIHSRCKILTGNVERLGLQNTVTTCLDSKRISDIFPKTFDLIMVDAPCSGEGMFRKEQIAIDEWSEENVKKCAVRQAEILENAQKCLKDGGYIIYATCTFSLEENEMIIDSFLQSHPEFEIIKVKDSVIENSCDGISFDGCKCENISYARRFYPHKTLGEGQFVAVLHNKNQNFSVNIKSYKRNTPEKIVFDFLDDVLIDYKKENVMIYNDRPVYFTPYFEIKNGTAFSCGVTIGEIKKNYILPHHQFFMALGKNFKRKIDLKVGSLELQKYLQGQEITTACENGWAVILVDGCTVGGVKVVSNVAKNHYPKGLRIKNDGF